MESQIFWLFQQLRCLLPIGWWYKLSLLNRYAELLPQVKAKEIIVDEQALRGILDTVKPYTMVPEPALRFTVERTVSSISMGVPGVIVECGVWRGGCSIAMMLAQRLSFGKVIRPVYLADSFEGLPQATDRDGSIAKHWQQGSADHTYNNCSATLDEVQSALTSTGIKPTEYQLVSGWFEDTLPELARQLAKTSIAVLRIDADWYDSVLSCLQYLEPLVSQEGTVILDDYYWWDGATRATHDYLSRSDMPYRIQSFANYAGAYFVKRPTRSLDKWYE